MASGCPLLSSSVWPGLACLRLAWEWPPSESDWPQCVVGREREREGERPRDESGNQRAGQRPPGQTIRGPLHYIYLNILTTNQLFVLSICVTFFTHLLMSSKEAVLWKDRTGLYCKRSHISLCHEGPTVAKYLEQYLVESILLPFCCMFLNTIRPGHHHVDGFQDLCLYCVFDFICYLRFIVTPENNLLQLTASNVVYLVIPVIGLLAWDGHQF